jgi:hypothetical protein
MTIKIGSNIELTATPGTDMVLLSQQLPYGRVNIPVDRIELMRALLAMGERERVAAYEAAAPPAPGEPIAYEKSLASLTDNGFKP